MTVRDEAIDGNARAYFDMGEGSIWNQTRPRIDHLHRGQAFHELGVDPSSGTLTSFVPGSAILSSSRLSVKGLLTFEGQDENAKRSAGTCAPTQLLFSGLIDISYSMERSVQRRNEAVNVAGRRLPPCPA